MTIHLRNQKNENTKKLSDYMNYVGIVIDILNDNSSNSKENINEEYFKNQ
jgi:hypothetical protein